MCTTKIPASRGGGGVLRIVPGAEQWWCAPLIPVPCLEKQNIIVAGRGRRWGQEEKGKRKGKGKESSPDSASKNRYGVLTLHSNLYPLRSHITFFEVM